MSFGPGLVLALVFALIATQVMVLVLPDAGGYLWLLALSAAGILLGEFVAQSGLLRSPVVGVVHPLADLIGIGLLQAAGMYARARRTPRDA